MLKYIDINALTLGMVVVNLFIGLALVILGHAWKNTIRGVERVGLALIIVSIALIFDAINGYIGSNFTIYSIISISIIASFAYLYLGVQEFQNRKSNYIFHILLLIAASVVILIFGIWKEDQIARITMFSLMLTFYAGALSYRFFIKAPFYNKRLYHLMGIYFLLFVLLNIIRLAPALYHDITSETEIFQLIQVIYIIGTMSIILLSGISFILLVNKELTSLRDQFTSVMAHDIKNPLSSIIGFSEVLRNTLPENAHEANKYLNIIRDSAGKSVEVINNALEWTKINFQKIEVRNSDIDVDNTFSDLVNMYKPSADLKTQTITFPQNTKTTILCDPILLNTILRNLISNAIKYTPENGHIIMNIEIKKDIKISVTDDGPGVSPEIIEQINSGLILPGQLTKSGTGGSGLGLFLCTKYIKLLQGSLHIETRDKGSQFVLILPKLSRSLPLSKNGNPHKSNK